MVSHLELKDIYDFEYIDSKTVCDLTVEQTHNYYLDCGKRILVHNSSKSFSICLAFIIKLLKEKNKTLTIARKTMPALRATAMRDFFDILKEYNLYHPENHNKSEHTYKLYSNLIEFVSMDQPQKKRGGKRNYLWLNESNEFDYEDFIQFNLRTSEQIFFDYNPSAEFHWIYDKVIPRKDCTFIKSTYKDNPFLEDSLVKEIEALKDEDSSYWLIYGMGEKGKSGVLIFDNWDVIDEMPQYTEETVYGVDFGYNHPSVVLQISLKDRHAYIDELLYERKLTNTDLIDKMRLMGIGKDIMKADCAEPDRIEEISLAGFNCIPCKKGKNSVKDSIDVVKRFHLHVTKRSVNTIKEFKGYKWKVNKNNEPLDEPVKFRDDSMAALRYGIGDNEGDTIFFPQSIQGRERDIPVSIGIRDTAGMDEEFDL